MSVTVYRTKTYVLKQRCCVMSCSPVCSFCRWHRCLVYVVAKREAVLERNKEEEGVQGVNSTPQGTETCDSSHTFVWGGELEV